MITLTLRSALAEPMGAEGWNADRFGALSSAEIAKLPVWVGTRRASLGDFFTVSGEKGTDVRVVGDVSLIDGIGTGMRGGTLTVDGSAGRDVGASMSGGTLDVTGNVGDGAGVGMAGGRLIVHGVAGDRLGAELPGASRGMTGGEIILAGNAGRDVGHRARRGLIVVGGDAGPGAARAMIAGTVFVRGTAGPGAGAWSKRGSVIVLGEIAVPETYSHACDYRPPIIPVLLRYLRRHYTFEIQDQYVTGVYRRWVGDLADVGKGEILRWVGA